MMKVGTAVRLLAIAVVLSLAAFVVAGCGSDEKKKDTVSADLSTGSTAESGDTKSGETKQFDSGEAVGSSKKLVVQSDADFSAEQQAIINRLAAFADATSNQDYKKLCEDLLSKAAQKIGGDCVKTFEQTGSQVKDFKIVVKSVKVNKDGKNATAAVNVTSNIQKGTQAQNLSLTKEGGDWRIQILGQ